jgi:hypothetical protein
MNNKIIVQGKKNKMLTLKFGPKNKEELIALVNARKFKQRN